MNKEFIPYEQALELKELGFDEQCTFAYSALTLNLPLLLRNWYQNSTLNFTDKGCTAPTFSQAFRWFREKHGLCGIVSPLAYEILDKNNEQYEWGCIEETLCETYEEAELACLKKLIEIVKEKNTLTNFTPHNANAVAEYNHTLKNFTPNPKK
jgi:hypothetical protein